MNKLRSCIRYGLASLLIITGSLVSPVPAPAASEPTRAPLQVTTQEQHESTAEYELNLKIPVISGLLDSAYQTKLNDKIHSQALQDKKDFLQAAHAQAEDLRQQGYPVRPVSLTILYHVHSCPTDRILSLEVNTSTQMGGTGKPRLDFYNIYNNATAYPLHLQDLLGHGYKERINREVSKQIDERLKQGIPYFKNQFHGISDTQGFYIQEGSVVIVFDKYAIAAGYVGEPRFIIPWNGQLHS